MDSQKVPSVNEVAIQLLRPLAWHDLTEREARIAVHPLRLEGSTAMSTLEELAAEQADAVDGRADSSMERSPPAEAGSRCRSGIDHVAGAVLSE